MDRIRALASKTTSGVVAGFLLAIATACTADRSANRGDTSRWRIAGSAGSLDIFAVQFLDARAGLAAGDIDPKGIGGQLYETDDGGRSWHAGAARTEIVTGLHFVDATTGWAVGYAGHIDRTDDGGRRWRVQRTERANEVLNAVYAIDKSHAWAVGARGVVLRTDDGGNTWTAVDIGRRQDLWAIRFVSPTRGWIVGDRGLVLETADAGNRWTPVESGTTHTLYGVAALPPRHVVAVGEAGTVVRSEDGGSWETTVAGAANLNGVAAAAPATFWAAGDRGTLAGSNDGGKTWNVMTSPTSVRLSAVSLADNHHGVAAGKRGVMLVLE